MTGNLLKVFYLSTMVNMSKFRTIAIVDMVVVVVGVAPVDRVVSVVPVVRVVAVGCCCACSSG